jgi:hypothetical protein
MQQSWAVGPLTMTIPVSAFRGCNKEARDFYDDCACPTNLDRIPSRQCQSNFDDGHSVAMVTEQTFCPSFESNPTPPSSNVLASFRMSLFKLQTTH